MEHENSALSQLPLTCVPKQLPHMHHYQKQHKAGKRRGRDGTSLVDDDDVWVAGVGGVGGEGEGAALPLSMTMTSGLQGWVGRWGGEGEWVAQEAFGLWRSWCLGFGAEEHWTGRWFGEGRSAEELSLKCTGREERRVGGGVEVGDITAAVRGGFCFGE